ncbi:hypothetical protein [Alkalihalobacillus sp. CinArs1]|uniref:hypothetical protein n=1 Tax=Alkalihalobacillus sp. CinArs1 TaxID=2995314 RepID=UPI0022DCF9EB|nr:hypothetical protein [Alkalihalobacillus sp. CinArs1]
MKKENPLPSRKEYHKHKAKKKGRSNKKREETTPSLTLVRILALLFISMVAIFLLYSIYS